jgi:uncharacterized membrane protein YeaQ/YmgE (transglycosylase-associated protein family)
MKKVLSAFLAVATVAGSLATAMPAAKADGGRIAAGVAGGLIGGALLGGAIASSRPAYGYGYGYAPARFMSKNPPAASCASASGTVTAGVSAAFRFAIDLNVTRASRET